MERSIEGSFGEGCIYYSDGSCLFSMFVERRCDPETGCPRKGQRGIAKVNMKALEALGKAGVEPLSKEEEDALKDAFKRQSDVIEKLPKDAKERLVKFFGELAKSGHAVTIEELIERSKKKTSNKRD